MRLGKGEKLADITSSMKAVAEGILTARAAHDLAAKLHVEAPIIDGIFRVRAVTALQLLTWLVHPGTCRASVCAELTWSD